MGRGRGTSQQQDLLSRPKAAGQLSPEELVSAVYRQDVGTESKSRDLELSWGQGAAWLPDKWELAPREEPGGGAVEGPHLW